MKIINIEYIFYINKRGSDSMNLKDFKVIEKVIKEVNESNEIKIINTYIENKNIQLGDYNFNLFNNYFFPYFSFDFIDNNTVEFDIIFMTKYKVQFENEYDIKFKVILKLKENTYEIINSEIKNRSLTMIKNEVSVNNDYIKIIYNELISKEELFIDIIKLMNNIKSSVKELIKDINNYKTSTEVISKDVNRINFTKNKENEHFIVYSKESYYLISKIDDYVEKSDTVIKNNVFINTTEILKSENEDINSICLNHKSLRIKKLLGNI